MLINEWLQKTSIPTQRMVTGNSKGMGVSKAEIFSGKYGARLKFVEGLGWGGGVGSGPKPNNHLWGGYGYFLEPQFFRDVAMLKRKKMVQCN